MKILKANNPESGKTPIVVSLDILCNGKLKDNYNPDTMNGRTKRYNTYLKDSFDKEGMRDPIKITPVKKKHGGPTEESMLIKYYADQWCRDNGYPLQQRYYKTVSRRPSPAVLRSSVRSR